MAPEEKEAPPDAAGGALDDRDVVPSLSDIGLDRFVPYLINRIAATWNVELADEVHDYDLTPPQMRALAVLHTRKRLTVNELSSVAVTDQSSMSRTVDSLEERGLVRRTQRASDMRVRDVEITEAGQHAFDQFWPALHRRCLRLLDGLDATEREQLVGSLRKLLENLAKMIESPSD